MTAETPIGTEGRYLHNNEMQMHDGRKLGSFSSTHSPAGHKGIVSTVRVLRDVLQFRVQWAARGEEQTRHRPALRTALRRGSARVYRSGDLKVSSVWDSGGEWKKRGRKTDVPNGVMLSFYPGTS